MSLQDLPNELIAAICEIADKDALMALRLTNKRTSKPATKSFSDRFMCSLSLVMTAPCLERLTEMCEHPSFGPGVRKIYITHRRMTSYRTKNLLNKRDRLIETAGHQNEEVTKAKLVVQRCINRYKDEKALKKEGAAIKLLTRAFHALQTWRHAVELYIMSTYKQHHGAIFLGSGYYEPHDHNTTTFDLTSTLQPCLEAVRISKIQFRKFDISVMDWSNNDKERDFTLDSFNEDDMKHFAMLESITFELTWYTSYKTKRAMATIVSQARELEFLHLSHGEFHCDFPGSDMHQRMQLKLGDNALQSVKSDRLQSVSFTEIHFSKQCLLEFLHLHHNTLKSLRFETCVLCGGSWYEVVSCMQQSLPHLSALNIDRLYDLESYYSYSMAIFGFGREGKEWVKGKEKVQAVLSAMIERPLDNPLAPPGNVHDNETLDE